MGRITVEGVGKAYKRYSSKWARLREWLTGRPRHEKTWVLRDVSFRVEPGEAVGIVGVNGAGKSTLLKIITGTTEPTTGRVTLEGRVAALLELGMGFHPDFTGRQNALIAGQLLGYSVQETLAVMPEIEAFADIGNYFDQPVRVYSSGMQVRVAFAAATAHRPDILVVDEALAVGDAAFQRRCFQRIEAMRASGTTLLFVSHDIETVKKLCDRAVLLDRRGPPRIGAARAICDEYERLLFGGSRRATAAAGTVLPAPGAHAAHFDPGLAATCEKRYGDGRADIEDCWLADEQGRRVNVIEAGTPFRWCFRVRFNAGVERPVYAMMLKTVEGVALYGVDTLAQRPARRVRQAGEEVEVCFALESPLAPGHYYLNCGVREDGADGDEFLCRRVDAAILRVAGSAATTAVVGLVELKARVDERAVTGQEGNVHA
jgi:lipopolysaccharide transport system ATP-binding protein